LRQRLSERFQNDREKTLKKYPVSHKGKPGLFFMRSEVPRD